MNLSSLASRLSEIKIEKEDKKKYYDTHIFENKSYEFNNYKHYKELYENSYGDIIGTTKEAFEDIEKIDKIIPFNLVDAIKSSYGNQDAFIDWFENVTIKEHRYYHFMKCYYGTKTIFLHKYDLDKYLREMQKIRPLEITRALEEISKDDYIIGYRACSCGQNTFSNSFSINPVATYKMYSKINPAKFFNKYIIEARIPLNNIVGFGGKQVEEVILLDKFNIQVTKIRNVSYRGYKMVKDSGLFK